jgi:isocitrate dehydrogenase kinase/phosphatase
LAVGSSRCGGSHRAVRRARYALCDRRSTNQLDARAKEVALWTEIKRAYEMLVARRPDSDFYRTFFNSITRDLFGTVGVNPEVEFCATSVGRASGAVPIRVYRVGGSLPTAVREILADLPFGAAIKDRTRPCIASARRSAVISRPDGRAAIPSPSN